jgi:hypothetical protein
MIITHPKGFKFFFLMYPHQIAFISQMVVLSQIDLLDLTFLMVDCHSLLPQNHIIHPIRHLAFTHKFYYLILVRMVPGIYSLQSTGLLFLILSIFFWHYLSTINYLLDLPHQYHCTYSILMMYCFEP